MNCVECERPANGVCKFCGRAVCKDHWKEETFILEIVPGEKINEEKFLVVEKALFCGQCRPVRNLITGVTKELQEKKNVVN